MSSPFIPVCQTAAAAGGHRWRSYCYHDQHDIPAHVGEDRSQAESRQRTGIGYRTAPLRTFDRARRCIASGPKRLARPQLQDLNAMPRRQAAVPPRGPALARRSYPLSFDVDGGAFVAGHRFIAHGLADVGQLNAPDWGVRAAEPSVQGFSLEYEIVPGVPAQQADIMFAFLVPIRYEADVDLRWDPVDGGAIAPFQSCVGLRAQGDQSCAATCSCRGPTRAGYLDYPLGSEVGDRLLRAGCLKSAVDIKHSPGDVGACRRGKVEHRSGHILHGAQSP